MSCLFSSTSSEWMSMRLSFHGLATSWLQNGSGGTRHPVCIHGKNKGGAAALWALLSFLSLLLGSRSLSSCSLATYFYFIGQHWVPYILLAARNLGKWCSVFSASLLGSNQGEGYWKWFGQAQDFHIVVYWWHIESSTWFSFHLIFSVWWLKNAGFYHQ